MKLETRDPFNDLFDTLQRFESARYIASENLKDLKKCGGLLVNHRLSSVTL